MDGYLRSERWEGRYRPQSKFEITVDDPGIRRAFKGFKNGFYQYEFLAYFDNKESKDSWHRERREFFSSMQKACTKLRSNEDLKEERNPYHTLNNSSMNQAQHWYCDTCKRTKSIYPGANEGICQESKEQMTIPTNELGVKTHGTDGMGNFNQSSEMCSLRSRIPEYEFEDYEDPMSMIDDFINAAEDIVSGKISDTCMDILGACNDISMSAFYSAPNVLEQ